MPYKKNENPPIFVNFLEERIYQFKQNKSILPLKMRNCRLVEVLMLSTFLFCQQYIKSNCHSFLGLELTSKLKKDW